jgi:hypothetical protein
MAIANAAWVWRFCAIRKIRRLESGIAFWRRPPEMMALYRRYQLAH